MIDGGETLETGKKPSGHQWHQMPLCVRVKPAFCKKVPPLSMKEAKLHQRGIPKKT